MKKTGIIMGTISVLLGFITIITTSIINEVIPKIGYAMSQASQAHGGSSSQDVYEMNFIMPNTIAIFLCIVGMGTIIYCLFSKYILKQIMQYMEEKK